MQSVIKLTVPYRKNSWRNKMSQKKSGLIFIQLNKRKTKKADSSREYQKRMWQRKAGYGCLNIRKAGVVAKQTITISKTMLGFQHSNVF